MRRLLVFALVLVTLASGTASPIAAQTETPTPYPTPTGIPIPNDQIFDGLNQGDQVLSDADTDLTAPDGSPLLPEDNTAMMIGYAKWLLSPAAAAEVMGSFAPLFQTVGFWLTMVLTLLGVYIAVYVGIYFLRWVIWLVRLIVQIASAIASVAGGAVGWLLSFIGL